MVQQPRQDEPQQYVCVIPVDTITGNEDEEIVAFGVSLDEAKNQAQKLLADNYGCNNSEIHLLRQQARIELLSQWCSPGDRQG